MLTKKGMKREDAYALVQKHAMDVWKTKTDFKKLLMLDGDVNKYLTKEELEDLFDLSKTIRNVDYIFKQVGI